jgi:hypothetical protein
MSNDAVPVIPPVAITSEPVTPVPEPALVAETHMPAPTVEQVQDADRAFVALPQPSPAITIAGLWTGMLILHDLAVETFDTSGEEEEDEEVDPDAKPADR